MEMNKIRHRILHRPMPLTQHRLMQVWHYIFFFLSSEAAYRYYKSKCEEESVKRRGKDSSQNLAKRRHERIARVSELL